MVPSNSPQKPTQKPAESAAGIVANGADTESGRERVVRAAYDLFSQHGTPLGVGAAVEAFWVLAKNPAAEQVDGSDRNGG